MDNSGTLSLQELQTLDNFADWEKVIKECDTNGDGVIDFEEFISAAMNRKILSQQ